MATKKTATAKTPAAPKGKVETPKTAWNAGKKVVQHGCRVGNQTFSSVWKAFIDLGIEKPESENYGPCVKFRKALKSSKDGKGTFEAKNGKKFNFVLVPKSEVAEKAKA